MRRNNKRDLILMRDIIAFVFHCDAARMKGDKYQTASASSRMASADEHIHSNSNGNRLSGREIGWHTFDREQKKLIPFIC